MRTGVALRPGLGQQAAPSRWVKVPLTHAAAPPVNTAKCKMQNAKCITAKNSSQTIAIQCKFENIIRDGGSIPAINCFYVHSLHSYTVYTASIVYTVYTVHSLQTAWHCFYSGMYACSGRLERRFWNGLMGKKWSWLGNWMDVSIQYTLYTVMTTRAPAVLTNIYFLA